MARNAHYGPGLDLWTLSSSQLTGYLGSAQRVSERLGGFIFLGVSPGRRGQARDTRGTTAETRGLIGGLKTSRELLLPQ